MMGPAPDRMPRMIAALLNRVEATGSSGQDRREVRPIGT